MPGGAIPIPPSTRLMESMRALGYDPEVAVADVIDNSITAGARTVEVRADVSENPSFLWILDDGRGMSLGQMVEALTLGEVSSVDAREAEDLGRFGLGLKTASFSQARSLTVVSRTSMGTSALLWDLDDAQQSGEWEVSLLDQATTHALPGFDALDELGTGTLVLWRKLDRLLQDTRLPTQRMAQLSQDIRRHLALTFHRFLEGPTSSRLAIIVNGTRVDPLDPFMRSNPATQSTAPEKVALRNSIVGIIAHVLPHASKYSVEEASRDDLNAGLFENQGFYFYRNHRLISHGGWSQLARKSDLMKYSRVQVDLPNTLDDLWHLDIKKEHLKPPQELRPALERFIRNGQRKSARIISYRGRRKNSDDIQYVWNYVEERGTFRYEPNLEHPLLEDALLSLDSRGQQVLRRVVEDLAAFLPFSDIHKRMSVESKRPQPEEDVKKMAVRAARLVDVMDLSLENQRHVHDVLSGVEPFLGRRDLDLIIDMARAHHEETS